MHVFYAPDVEGDRHFLDAGESRHCIRVLRMKRGTPVKLVDGKGTLYEGMIFNPDPTQCEIEILRVIKDYGTRPYRLHIAISLLKNPERFEWFVEKGVEIGIDEITPVICSKTEKRSFKAERIRSIMISAMKQSLKTVITAINDPVFFPEFLHKKMPGFEKYIAHCSPGIERRPLASCYGKGKDAVILIGPEGDFDDEEIMMAARNGFRAVDLGSSRLRTETAGVVACHSIYFMNQ